MRDAGVVWAESVLGEPVVEVSELTGGVTSKMLALRQRSGRSAVLRLVTNEPWRQHGADLTLREQAALRALENAPVPSPVSLGLDAAGASAGAAAHLMSRLPGAPSGDGDAAMARRMAELLVTIHDVRPAAPFRDFQSWAWPAKWVVPEWTGHPEVWQRAFDLLAQDPPPFEPTFLHRDFSHRNLLWADGRITGVVDWVEASSGPRWLDAGHGATNLAVAYGLEAAQAFLKDYAALTGTRPEPYWLVMDVVGFLPPPGKQMFFDSADARERLDAWITVALGEGRYAR